MTREELKPLAKQYFSDPSRAFIFGTDDAHFFYEEIQAQRYCKQFRVYYQFTREDFAKKKRVVKETPVIEQPKAEVPAEPIITKKTTSNKKGK